MRGCLIWQVAVALSRTKESAVEAHARDELGIDIDDAPSPIQARAGYAASSAPLSTGVRPSGCRDCWPHDEVPCLCEE